MCFTTSFCCCYVTSDTGHAAKFILSDYRFNMDADHIKPFSRNEKVRLWHEWSLQQKPSVCVSESCQRNIQMIWLNSPLNIFTSLRLSLFFCSVAQVFSLNIASANPFFSCWWHFIIWQLMRLEINNSYTEMCLICVYILISVDRSAHCGRPNEL